MDVLSQVLHTVRLQSLIYCHSELTAAWDLHVEGAAGHAGFFVVTRGSCYLEREGLHAPLALAGSDLTRVRPIGQHAAGTFVWILSA
jgi:Cupin